MPHSCDLEMDMDMDIDTDVDIYLQFDCLSQVRNTAKTKH